MAFKTNFFIMALFVAIGFIAVTEAWHGTACPANEERAWCGSSCPVTCANLAAPPQCSGCVKGCFCRQGFFRNAVGLCVLAADC